MPVDISRDNRPDNIYLKRTKRSVGGIRNDKYELFVELNLGNSRFGAPILVKEFSEKPAVMRFKEVNGDGRLDFVYLVRTELTGGGRLLDKYGLFVMAGFGNGTFAKPRVVREFRGRPWGLKI